MGKRPIHDDDMQELQDIRARLTHQDQVLKDQSETLKQIFWTLKGSVSLGLDGLMPTVEKLEQTITKMDESMRQIISDLAHLQKWKLRMQRGDFNVNVPTALQTFMKFLGWAVAAAISIWAIISKS